VNPAPVPIKPVPVARPVVLMFSASWCPQCKHFETEVLSRQEVKDALNLFDFRIINSDSDKEAVKKYKVTALPTFVKVDGGKHVGYMQPSEFVSWLNSKKDTGEE
jgi:thioredoxin-related protein